MSPAEAREYLTTFASWPVGWRLARRLDLTPDLVETRLRLLMADDQTAVLIATLVFSALHDKEV